MVFRLDLTLMLRSFRYVNDRVYGLRKISIKRSGLKLVVYLVVNLLPCHERISFAKSGAAKAVMI